VNTSNKKNWIKRKWKWLIALLFLVFFIGLFISSIKNELSGFMGVYTDSAIYEGALEKANQNEEVLQKLGKIQAIGFIEVMEGAYKYSNNNNSIILSISIKGSKKNGKLDVSADRKEKAWFYTKIGIRLKKPKEVIEIL